MNKISQTNQPKIKQLNFKVPEDFYWKLKNLATIKRCKMAQVLERAFKFYEKREQITNELNNYRQEINTHRQTIQLIEQQMQDFQGRMNWPELEAKVNHLTPTYFNKIGLTTTYQTLKETLEDFLKAGRMLRQRGVLF